MNNKKEITTPTISFRKTVKLTLEDYDFMSTDWETRFNELSQEKINEDIKQWAKDAEERLIKEYAEMKWR